MRITVKGTVQGVGFRPAVYRAAVSAGINGSVRNNGSDVVIDADRGDVLIETMMKCLPSLSKIDDITVEDIPYNGKIGFEIIRSGGESGGGVSVPSDIAICSRCIDEMKGAGRRSGYPFTTCTDCGPRFTLIETLPYDRQNTAMRTFSMCPECMGEYNSPSDRRFHHQAVCCPVCGPRYTAFNSSGNVIDGNPISTFSKMINSGKVGIIKSWGGMHICSGIDHISKLREWYGRKQKPFAVMVRNEDALLRYGIPSSHEMNLLTSPYRPIVIVKKVTSDITDIASPGLDNIGLFLPYTGMQHLLFDFVNTDALVMTSANTPGEPMILKDNDIFSMGADVYLLHDQQILNRADDTVVRSYCGNTSFIRRSRGYTPSHIDTKMKSNVLALGAQENLTASVSSKNRIYTTQHIGNGESSGVIEYLRSASLSLIEMTGSIPQLIAIDLHPGYSNRKIASALSEEMKCEIIEVQHHWAHCASLLTDRKRDDGVFIAIDGTGYGDDGNAWGGEVMYADLDSYERIAHLQGIPLLGGEKAVRDIKRLKFAVDVMNGTDSKIFNDMESSVLKKMMGKSTLTTSLGRLLDTLAYTLNVCKERTYDGEPAMKMEPLLSRGRMIDGFDTTIRGKEVITVPMFRSIEKNMKKDDVAYSIVMSAIAGMVNVAADLAQKKGIKEIGVTGGVSYSAPVCDMIKHESENRGMKAIFHNDVPNGDGGISVGQAAIAMRRIS